MNRRHLGKVLGGHFGLLLAASVLAGTNATFIPSVAFGAETPREGGVLIYGRGGDSVSLDPAKETDGESLNVCDNIFDTLVQFKLGTTEIEPGLAESWSVTPDGTSYTFKLRPNVKFHDGTPLDADAVIFSLMRQHDAKHEAYGYAKAWNYWNDMGMNTLVKAMTKVDANTVKIELARPEAPFLANMAMQFASIVSPTAVRKFKEDFAKNPVGTGPFKFVSWTKGERIVLDANKEFWGQKPKLARVIFRSIPDSSARLNAFLAKEIHMMNQPTPDQVATIKQRRPDASVMDAPGMNVAYLAFNVQKKPFDNAKVRQALNTAVNKDAIIKGIYSGMGMAAVNPIPPSLWGYNTSVKQYAYSIERSKQLLKEAGFPNGFKTTLYYMPVSRPYMPDGKKVAEAIQADLKKIGVEVSLSTYEWGTYLDKTKNGEHEMALLGWSGDNGDPDNFLHVLLSGENTKPPAANIAFYNNTRVTDILRQAKTVSEQSKRASLYQEAQTIIHKDAPWIPIAHSRVAMPMDKRVNGYVMTPNETRRFNTVWLAK
ncbi:MAG: ABC transporter substrate-binding protein [Silvanigrellales bacterium]|jgi:peptide/nickel transport system substrate-binding protein|nr:ABC transporter substrate-binding protein [Silvanigrellales bacterium]